MYNHKYIHNILDSEWSEVCIDFTMFLFCLCTRLRPERVIRTLTSKVNICYGQSV